TRFVSDWSADVCSSDLAGRRDLARHLRRARAGLHGRGAAQAEGGHRAARRRLADRVERGGRSAVITSAQQTRQPVGSRLLVIVSRDAPGRFAYLKHLYGNETVEVIVDRRVRERRRRYQLVVNERRWQGRRRRNLSEELDNFGWTLVRR